MGGGGSFALYDHLSGRLRILELISLTLLEYGVTSYLETCVGSHSLSLYFISLSLTFSFYLYTHICGLIGQSVGCVYHYLLCVERGYK